MVVLGKGHGDAHPCIPGLSGGSTWPEPQRSTARVATTSAVVAAFAAAQLLSWAAS